MSGEISDATVAVAYAPGSGGRGDAWVVYFDAQESDRVISQYLIFDGHAVEAPEEVQGLESAIRARGLSFVDDPHWANDCPGVWSARLRPADMSVARSS